MELSHQQFNTRLRIAREDRPIFCNKPCCNCPTECGGASPVSLTDFVAVRLSTASSPKKGWTPLARSRYVQNVGPAACQAQGTRVARPRLWPPLAELTAILRNWSMEPPVTSRAGLPSVVRGSMGQAAKASRRQKLKSETAKMELHCIGNLDLRSPQTNESGETPRPFLFLALIPRAQQYSIRVRRAHLGGKKKGGGTQPRPVSNTSLHQSPPAPGSRGVIPVTSSKVKIWKETGDRHVLDRATRPFRHCRDYT